MQASDLFPIQLYPSDKYGFADSPVISDKIWRRLREEEEECKGITWYATGITIHGLDKAVVDVYDMEDTFRGGIGKIIFSIEVDRFTLVETTLIEDKIATRKLAIAESVFEFRENEKRRAAIQAIREELFPNV